MRKLWQIVLPLILALLVSALPVFAAGVAIDGSFSDWATKPKIIDNRGVDDEKSPEKSDITEFSADADSSGLYMLMTWDNNDFTGGQASTAGITVKGADKKYYRIYVTATDVSVPLSTLQIDLCSDAACTKETVVCTGTGCTTTAAAAAQPALVNAPSATLSGQVASETTWTDPFAGTHQTNTCTGTTCTTQDMAAEIFTPWPLVGGQPTSGNYVFLQYYSYPSGPGKAQEDSMDTANGLACANNGGTFSCYVSSPTAVTLQSFNASSPVPQWMLVGAVAALLSLFSILFRLTAQRKRFARAA